jgi:thiamine pyrophosphate-dependent acetolactate synthase large subunit-like protein
VRCAWPSQRGVAVVVIPGDVALRTTSAKVPKWLLPTTPMVRPSDHDIKRLASLLNDASASHYFVVRAAPASIPK